jgi:hypothetical protein
MKLQNTGENFWKEHTKIEEFSFLWIGRSNIIEIYALPNILLNTIYSFSVVPIKILVIFLTGGEHSIIKFIVKPQMILNNQSNI